MVLHDSSFEQTPSNLMKNMAKLLNTCEAKWTSEQQLLLKQKVEEKMEKAKNPSQYVHKLLALCKTWRGLAISIEELELIISKHPDETGKIVKTELTYYKDSHHSEVIATPSLFKLNKISHEERLSNLCIFLNGQSISFMA